MDRHDAITRAYVIPGQTWPSELGWLYDQLSASRHHAEVGVFCGRSLYASCGGMTDATVYAVDLDQPNLPSLATPCPLWLPSVQMATFNAIEDGGSVMVKPLLVGSLQAARALRASGVRLDSVFLDGSHHYADVVADINEWLPLLRPSGLICGHDYSTAFPGVMDAVNELVQGFAVAPDTRIWWAIKT